MKILLAFLLFFAPVGARLNLPAQYSIQEGTPLFLPNFIAPEAGCNWAGVAGQVFDQAGEPVAGLFVKIFGILDGQPVEVYTLSGAAVQVGPGGFEVTMTDHLVTGEVDMLIQLLDISGEPISPAMDLPFHANCEQNLTLLNFVRVSMDNEVFLPLIKR